MHYGMHCAMHCVMHYVMHYVAQGSSSTHYPYTNYAAHGVAQRELLVLGRPEVVTHSGPGQPDVHVDQVPALPLQPCLEPCLLPCLEPPVQPRLLPRQVAALPLWLRTAVLVAPAPAPAPAPTPASPPAPTLALRLQTEVCLVRLRRPLKVTELV